MRRKKDIKNPKGASLVEYGMLAGLISVASIGAVVGVGEEVEETFCRAAEVIKYYRTGETPDCVTDLGLTPRFGDLYGSGGGSGEESSNHSEIPNIRSDGQGVDETAYLSSGDIGDQSFGIPIPNGGFPGDGPFSVLVTVTEGDGSAAACSGSEGTLDNCGVDDVVSSVEIQPEDTHFGYTLNIPDDPSDEYSLGVNVKVIDTATGNVVYESDGGVEKETADISISLPDSLGHYDIAAGTTGTYYIWAPIFDFNSPFQLLLDDDSTLPGASEVCLQGFDETIECGASLTMRPELHSAIGFSIRTLPDKTTSVADYDVKMIFRSTVDTDHTYYLGATATREPEPIIATFGETVFDDVSIAAGETNYAYMPEFLGHKNDWSYLEVVGNPSNISVCYTMTEISSPICDTDDSQLNFTQNPYSIGWIATGITSNERSSYSDIFALKIGSRIDGSIVETTRTISVVREDPDYSDLTAQSCHDYYLAGERTDGLYNIQLGGEIPAALFCNFIDDGTSMSGGWTAVTTSSTYNEQGLSNPVANTFNAYGREARGFTLNGSDMPPHSVIAIGQIATNGPMSLFGAVSGNWNPNSDVSLSGTDYMSGTAMTIAKSGNTMSSATEEKTLLALNENQGTAKKRITVINGSSRSLFTDTNLSVGVFVR